MTICIVDDHQLLGQSLKYLFANAPDVTDIHVYTSPKAFLAEAFTDWRPDIVIVDMLMPGMNGFEMITQSQAILPETKFIILTSLMDSDKVKEAFRLGIVGYITKDASEAELFKAIETVQAGGKYINPSMKDKLVENLFEHESTEYQLSSREKEVLQQICSGSTPKEIAHQMNLSIHTIQQFIKRIMRKMKVNRTTDVVMVAIRTGLYKLS